MIVICSSCIECHKNGCYHWLNHEELTWKDGSGVVKGCSLKVRRCRNNRGQRYYRNKCVDVKVVENLELEKVRKREGLF